MRLVRVTVPQGKGAGVADLAFSCGVQQVSTRMEQSLSSDGRSETRDVVEMKLATPTARTFLDALTASPSFDPSTYSLELRAPRSFLSPGQTMAQITWPLPEPGIDLFEELWQFTHVTWSFVLRVIVAAGILGYGVLEDKILLMIGGLLFMPVLPAIIAIGTGFAARFPRLSLQGAIALGTAMLLILATTVVLGWALASPILFKDLPNLVPGLFISFFVGLAAATANIDHGGKRELIGLAAAAQIAIVPVWLGLGLGCLAAGRTVDDWHRAGERALSLGVNIAMIVAAATIVYLFTGYRRNRLPAR
jgi:hypothetical protein